MEKNRPLQSFNEKGVDVAVWESSYGPTISIKKRFKDKKTGEWKDSKTYFPAEAAVIQKLLGQALDHIGHTNEK